MTMGDRIRQRRIELHMTQAELGVKLGIKASAIAKYESGRVENIKRSNISKLADALETTPAFLMGWDEDTNIEDLLKNVPESKLEKINKIVSLLSELTEEEIKDVVKHIEYTIYIRDKK